MWKELSFFQKFLFLVLVTLVSILCTALFGAILGCDHKICYFMHGVKNGTHYEVAANETTPAGISLDTSGYEIDLQKLDKLTDEVEICLHGIFYTYYDKSDFWIDRSCLEVKIAPDWFTAPCPEQAQAFPCELNPSLCGDPAKRLERGCVETDYFKLDGCYCAGLVQDGQVLVVTPNLAAYKHELLHVVLNADDPIPPPFDECEHTIYECPMN